MGPGTIRCLAHFAWPMLWVRQCALSPYPLLDYLSSRSVHGARRCDSGGKYQYSVSLSSWSIEFEFAQLEHHSLHFCHLAQPHARAQLEKNKTWTR